LRGLVRTGLEFVQPGSAVTWLADVSGGFFVRLGFRLTRDGLWPGRARGFGLVVQLGNTIRGGGLAAGFCCLIGFGRGDVAEVAVVLQFGDYSADSGVGGRLRRLPLQRPRLPGVERGLLFACDRTVDGR
jgi:hypothetical protein